VTGVAVVKRGTWSGKRWELVAYRSATDGICFSMTPLAGHDSTGAGMDCDQIEGVPPTTRTKRSTPHGITYLAGSSDGFPAYIVGPVVEAADVVVVHLATGRVVRTRTFDAPKALGAAIRFYAVRLERRDLPPVRRPAIESLVGLDDRGRIVACLLPRMPLHGVPSPRAANRTWCGTWCRPSTAPGAGPGAVKVGRRRKPLQGVPLSTHS
jgi:hypothetical protein